MSNLAALISHGFRNPGVEERQEIMALFKANAAIMASSAAREHAEFGSVVDDDEPVPEWVTMGNNGKCYRFVQLAPSEIARLYNNPEDPDGVRAVPRLESAICFTNRRQEFVDILFASNGYIIICGFPRGSLIAGDHVDPIIERVSDYNRRSKQHIPRPPNAFILYRNHKMMEVKKLYPGLGNNDISKVVGKLWHAESAGIKEHFKHTAELLRRNPHYKYKPRKANQIVRRPGGSNRTRFGLDEAVVRKA
ncbi:hypothetical protein FN846DRAFT_924729 [Sphaerosporella brunnea]|uniref:HMG box domain-containing protein n=1 Tax=Sphaerosporella brunnea TaxID=1250544 RepID=A0A5J5FAZ3_9PEZI|nr:hypothetical protein FN846DRAFT_924729 [Sphaerosporella brunnea]